MKNRPQPQSPPRGPRTRATSCYSTNPQLQSLFGGPVRWSYQVTIRFFFKNILRNEVPFGGPVRGSYQATTRTPEPLSNRKPRNNFQESFHHDFEHYDGPPERAQARAQAGTQLAAQSPSQKRLAGVRSEGKKDRERRGCGANGFIYNRNVLISHFRHQETYEQKQSPHIYSTKLYTELDRDSENTKVSRNIISTRNPSLTIAEERLQGASRPSRGPTYHFHRTCGHRVPSARRGI